MMSVQVRLPGHCGKASPQQTGHQKCLLLPTWFVIKYLLFIYVYAL